MIFMDTYSSVVLLVIRYIQGALRNIATNCTTTLKSKTSDSVGDYTAEVSVMDTNHESCIICRCHLV